MIFAFFAAEIGIEPTREARGAVPSQRVQIIADGVTLPFIGAQIDGLMDRILTDLFQPRCL